jgi:hypothetical protein
MRHLSARFAPLPSILVFAAATLLAAGCSESPTAPSDGGGGDPGPGLTPSPGTASVQITINPNPVPFSGSPITDAAACAGYENTWFYDQVLQEFAGTETTFTSRIDYFDGKTANNIQGLNIVVPARGTHAIRTRWCSGAGTAHTAQSQFTGTDANGNAVTVISPVAQLMAPGR